MCFSIPSFISLDDICFLLVIISFRFFPPSSSSSSSSSSTIGKLTQTDYYEAFDPHAPYSFSWSYSLCRVTGSYGSGSSLCRAAEHSLLILAQTWRAQVLTSLCLHCRSPGGVCVRPRCVGHVGMRLLLCAGAHIPSSHSRRRCCAQQGGSASWRFRRHCVAPVVLGLISRLVHVSLCRFPLQFHHARTDVNARR